jgi:hypothetical protein
VTVQLREVFERLAKWPDYSHNLVDECNRLLKNSLARTWPEHLR